MLTFAYYLLKVLICSAIMYGYYLIALRNKRFHQYNRWYLLSAVGLSFLVPLFKIEFWKETVQPSYVLKVITIVNDADVYVAKNAPSFWNWDTIALGVFSLVSFVFLLSIIIAVIKIFVLIKKYPKKFLDKICFVFSNTPGTPFSFFRYIFWNTNIDIDSEAGKHILKHELAHVEEKHSGDKLFINLALIIGWYNPFLWLIRKELNLIHEFIADQKAVNNGDTHAFAEMLVKSNFPSQSFLLANSFFHSPIKRRLLMITKSKQKGFSYFSRIAILPLLTLVVTLFAFKFKESKKEAFDSTNSKKSTNAIDFTKTSYTHIGVIVGSDKKMIFSKDRSGNLEIFSKETAMRKFNWKEADIDKFLNDEITVEADAILFHNYNKGVLRDDTSRYIQENRSDTGNTKKYLQDLGKQGESQEKYLQEMKKQSEFKEKYLQDLQKQSRNKQKYLQDKEGYKKEKQQYLEERARQEVDSKLIMQAAAGSDEPAQFPGGANAWRKYLQRNLDANVCVNNKAPFGVYTVKLAFNVSKEGTISNIIAETNPGYGTVDEAIKVIAKGPKWEPGKKDGLPINSRVKQSISFMVADESYFNDSVAQFAGGLQEWRRYLERNVDLKTLSEHKAPEGKYRVTIAFTVGKDGSLSNIAAETNMGYGTEEAVIKAIGQGRKWQPAKKDGAFVETQVKQTLTLTMVKERWSYVEINSISVGDVKTNYVNTPL